MPASDGNDPIADDELLYRRIPASQDWYDPEKGAQPLAFRPRKHDITGLSLARAKYTTIEDAAKGWSGNRYFVAVLKAGDLRVRGIEVVPRPVKGDPGHAELPGLTHENRRSDQALEWQVALAQELCLRVEGPFP